MGQRVPIISSKPLEKLIIICGYCETQNDIDNSLCKSCLASLGDEITQRRNKKNCTLITHNSLTVGLTFDETEMPSLYGGDWNWEKSMADNSEPEKKPFLTLGTIGVSCIKAFEIIGQAFLK